MSFDRKRDERKRYGLFHLRVFVGIVKGCRGNAFTLDNAEFAFTLPMRKTVLLYQIFFVCVTYSQGTKPSIFGYLPRLSRTFPPFFRTLHINSVYAKEWESKVTDVRSMDILKQ